MSAIFPNLFSILLGRPQISLIIHILWSTDLQKPCRKNLSTKAFKPIENDSTSGECSRIRDLVRSFSRAQISTGSTFRENCYSRVSFIAEFYYRICLNLSKTIFPNSGLS